MPEVWKDVPGYEGLYQVSDLGRVKSLSRAKVSDEGHRVVQKVKKILKPAPRKGGYLMVPLRRGGIQRYYFIHRLVLTSFLGPCPVGMQCCHGDGDPANNRLGNLRWDTPRNNCRDRGNAGVAKLTEEQVREIRRIYRGGGTSMGKIAREFFICQPTVSRIVNRQVWNHVVD